MVHKKKTYQKRRRKVYKIKKLSQRKNIRKKSRKNLQIGAGESLLLGNFLLPVDILTIDYNNYFKLFPHKSYRRVLKEAVGFGKGGGMGRHSPLSAKSKQYRTFEIGPAKPIGVRDFSYLLIINGVESDYSLELRLLRSQISNYSLIDDKEKMLVLPVINRSMDKNAEMPIKPEDPLVLEEFYNELFDMAQLDIFRTEAIGVNISYSNKFNYINCDLNFALYKIFKPDIHEKLYQEQEMNSFFHYIQLIENKLYLTICIRNGSLKYAFRKTWNPILNSICSDNPIKDDTLSVIYSQICSNLGDLCLHNMKKYLL